MWTLVSAISLAVMHIAGDNVGVVPDLAVKIGPGIYSDVILAYMVFGSLVAGLSAWIGAKSGNEMGILVGRNFGGLGKKMLAMSVLSISVPASALTGGYFCGWLLHNLTGVPYPLGVVICLAFFTLLAAGYCEELRAIAGYGSLLLIPLVMLLAIMEGLPAMVPTGIGPGAPDWLVIFALLGFNAGGMRPLLVAEASVYLAKNGRRAVLLAVVSKLLEGIITLLIVQLVVATGSEGPLALSGAAAIVLGPGGGTFFDVILFCAFLNTMTPAMIVNAKQTATLTGMGVCQSLFVAALTVYFVTFLDYNQILRLMSGTGLLMVGVIGFIAYKLHKQLRRRR